MAKMSWATTDDLLIKEKEETKNRFSSLCQEAIFGGFEVEILGRDYHFSYDQEAQINFQETMRLFENNLITDLNWTAHFNGERVRVKLNKTIFEQIYLASVKSKLEKISYLRDELSVQVELAKTKEELATIAWDFKEKDRVVLSATDTMEKRVAKIGELEQDYLAQKQYNTYMESSLMEVIDFTLFF